MNLTVRATGNNEDELLKSLEDVVNAIRTSKAHSGCVQQAVGDHGYYAHYRFENVDERTEPTVALPRGAFAQLGDSLTPVSAPSVNPVLVPAPYPSQR